MAMNVRSTVVGVFRDESSAQAAVRDLKQAGFRDDQIGLVGRSGDKDHPGEVTKTGPGGEKVAMTAAAGALTGAGIAALWSIGTAFAVVPVIGPVIAAGPIAAALLSAAGGAVVGGLVGSLVGLGIPEHEAKYYEGEVHAGRYLVTVTADGRYNEAWAVLQRHGAYNQETAAAASGTQATAPRSHASATAATAGRDTAGQTMKLHEEQLRATKTPVEAGEVRVRKEVHTEQQNIQVPVQREEVVIERHPASGRASASDIRPGEEVRIPVREERVHVEKENVVKEEVRVGKRKVTDTENVSGTVRKEEVKVEQKGDVKVKGNAGSPGAGSKQK